MLPLVDVPLPSPLPSTRRFHTYLLERVPLCCAGKFHVRTFLSSRAGWDMEQRRKVLLSWLILIFCKYFRLALAFSFSNDTSHSEFKPKEYWSKNTIYIYRIWLHMSESTANLYKFFWKLFHFHNCFQTKSNFAPSKGLHLIGCQWLLAIDSKSFLGLLPFSYE